MRRLEHAGLAVALERQLGPADEVVALPQQHVAAPADLLRVEVVGEEVGEHGLATRAQLHGALGFDARLRALEAIGAQEQRALVGAIERQRCALPDAASGGGSGRASSRDMRSVGSTVCASACAFAGGQANSLASAAASASRSLDGCMRDVRRTAFARIGAF